MSKPQEAFSILRNIIFTINDFDEDRKDFFANKGFLIKEQRQDERMLRIYENINSISAKLGVDGADGERNDYRAEESCLVETPFGLYSLSIDCLRVKINYASFSIPLPDITFDIFGSSDSSTREAVLFHLKELSSLPKDNVMEGYTQNVAYVSKSDSKISVKEVVAFKQFIDYCLEIHIINFEEKETLYNKLNINQKFIKNHSIIENLETSFDNLISYYKKHKRVVDKNGYYNFNDNDDFLKCVINENFICIESGDQSHYTVMIKEIKTNRLKIWKSANLNDISLDDYIGYCSLENNVNVTNIMRMYCSSFTSLQLPVEFEHTSYEKSFDFLINNFEYDGDYLAYDSNNGINSNMLWFLENRIKYFQYFTF